MAFRIETGQPGPPRLLVVLLWGAFAIEAALSLSWVMQQDAPLLHYAAFLVDRHDFVLYRDVLEPSGIGTRLFHLAIGKLLGYGDLAFRAVDLGLLAILLGLTGVATRRFGLPTALTTAAAVGLFYLGRGPAMSLQKDHVGAMLLAAALAVGSSARSGGPLYPRAAAVGGFFGAAALIKPQLVLGLPIVLALLAADTHPAEAPKSGRALTFARSFMVAGVGILAVCAPAFIWLWSEGALPYFWEIYTRYLPLHLQLTGEHETIAGGARLVYLARGYMLEMQAWAFPVLAGLYVASHNGALSSRGRRLTLAFGALAAVYSIYPVFAGQFWDYHWMPFRYFAVLCASLLVVPIDEPQRGKASKRFLLLAFVGFLLLFATPHAFIPQVLDAAVEAPRVRRTAEIESFLRDANLGPSDRVQPLDGTGGSIHTLLRAEAVLATTFLYDYHFYHHVSQPYVRTLRRRFIEQLEASPPRFVIDMQAKPRPRGRDTSDEFPALERFLEQRYHEVLQGDRYRILERKIE